MKLHRKIFQKDEGIKMRNNFVNQITLIKHKSSLYTAKPSELAKTLFRVLKIQKVKNYNVLPQTLRKNFPYSGLFWSAVSRISTE